MPEKRVHESFGKTLEERARLFAGDLQSRSGTTITSSLEREIALLLDQLDEVRSLHKALRKNLLRLECYVSTDIANLYPRPAQYFDEKIEERNKLKTKLLKIEEERRDLAVDENENIHALHDRLLSLINKLEQLRM